MSLRLMLIGAIAIAFLAVGSLALYWRGNAIAAAAERDRAYADLRVAVEANRINLDAIAALRAEAEANDRLNAELAERLEAINASIVEGNKVLGELRETNADVRSYLDTPVPDDLRRLYDRGSKGGGPH